MCQTLSPSCRRPFIVGCVCHEIACGREPGDKGPTWPSATLIPPNITGLAVSTAAADIPTANVTRTSLAGLKGCGLRPAKFEHRNGADSSSLAFVLGKAWVAPRLLGVDAVAFGAGQFADGHPVGLGSAFDTAVTGGGQVVVPVRVGGCSTLGCEDVDDVRLGVVREVHSRGDILAPARAARVVQQDQRSALERPANPALVRSELRDRLRVPVAHLELLSLRGWRDERPNRQPKAASRL